MKFINKSGPPRRLLSRTLNFQHFLLHRMKIASLKVTRSQPFPTTKTRAILYHLMLDFPTNWPIAKRVT
jgi:hypothetical protein